MKFKQNETIVFLNNELNLWSKFATKKLIERIDRIEDIITRVKKNNKKISKKNG